MKYLKTYESQKVCIPYFWYINGDYKKCKFIAEKFANENINIDIDFYGISERVLGIYIGFRDHWIYWEIEDDMDIVNGKNYFNYDNFKFGGELKYKNGKIVIDKLPVDIDKYNL